MSVSEHVVSPTPTHVVSPTAPQKILNIDSHLQTLSTGVTRARVLNLLFYLTSAPQATPPLGGYAPAGSYGPSPALRAPSRHPPTTNTNSQGFALALCAHPFNRPPQAGDSSRPPGPRGAALPLSPVTGLTALHGRARPPRGSCAPPASRLPPATCLTGRGLSVCLHLSSHGGIS